MAGGVAAPQGCPDGAPRPAPGAPEGLAPPGSWRGWGTGSPCMVSPPPAGILVRCGDPPSALPVARLPAVCLLCSQPPRGCTLGSPRLGPGAGALGETWDFFWGGSLHPKTPMLTAGGPDCCVPPPALGAGVGPTARPGALPWWQPGWDKIDGAGAISWCSPGTRELPWASQLPFAAPLLAGAPPAAGSRRVPCLLGAPRCILGVWRCRGRRGCPSQSVAALWCCCQVWRSSPCSWHHMMVRLK